MDNTESRITPEKQYKEDIASIKKCLEVLAAEFNEVKVQVKKQTELVGDIAKSNTELMQKWNTREDFITFDDEISNVNAEFKRFLEILKKLYTINANSIEKNLNKYFKAVLNALFGKNLLQDISWGKYCDKLSVKNSTVIDAIQRSGAIVDSLSTEYGRLKVLQKEFTKYKDAKRDRSTKPHLIIPHGGDDILDDSSPQQQEPNLMIGGDELIEFEVVTTEEEEYLLSPTYTDGSTVYEPFDEVFTIQNDVSNDKANDATGLILDKVSKGSSSPNSSDVYTTHESVAGQKNDEIDESFDEFIATNVISTTISDDASLNCAKGDVSTSLKECGGEDHSTHPDSDHSYAAPLNTAQNHALAENELSYAQMPHQNKIREIENVTPEITRYKLNKETSQKDRIPLSVIRIPKSTPSFKSKIQKEKVAKKLRRQFIAKCRQNSMKPKPKWHVQEM